MITIPLDLARITPETAFIAHDAGTHIVFGGLVVDRDTASMRAHKREFWNKDMCNGVLVEMNSPTHHEFEIQINKTHRWLPDNDVMDNIDAQALKEMGVGEIRWSTDTPSTSAEFKPANGPWYQAGFEEKWSWREAIQQLMNHAGIEDNNAALQSARKRLADTYCKNTLEVWNHILKGDIYAVVVYAVEKMAKTRDACYDHEVFGYAGKKDALEALEEGMNEVIKSVEKNQQDMKHNDFGPT